MTYQCKYCNKIDNIKCISINHILEYIHKNYRFEYCLPVKRLEK